MARLGSRVSVTEAARLFQLLAHLAQLATLAVGVSRVVHRLGRRAHARTRHTRVGSGGHNITETKYAYKASLSREEFLAQNEFGQMISDPKTADPASREHRKFVAEFRVPFAVYTQILEDVRGSAWSGSTAARGGVGGRPGLSLEAKVLSALYRLGTGCVARTQGSLFGMSASTAQRFFVDFCAHLSQRFQDECSVPCTEDEIKHVEHVYARMGFPGCVGSVDGVHLHWGRCPARLLTRHKGAKGYPTRSFNVTVDHRRFVQHVASSKPGTMNDKSSVRYDPHVIAVRQGMYKDFRYKLGGKTVSGGWLMSDGGYHRWRCLQCPRSHDTRPCIAAWSKALESVRKDVECTFGIMKGRFRILKLPLDFQHEQEIDYLFYTCAYLHNWVQRYQGFGEVWQEDEDWVGLAGKFHPGLCGRRRYFGSGKLHTYDVHAHTDYSSVGGGLDDGDDVEYGEHEQWRMLGEELANHYFTELRHGRLQWPKSQRSCAQRLKF